VRIYVADRAAATLSVISAFSYKRLRVVRLRGSRPLALAVQPGLALVLGTDASETLDGSRGADRIVALGGDDLVRAGRGDDLLEGGAGDDTLSGSTGDDIFDGGDGNDRAFGGKDNDAVIGGAGNDQLVGGPGDATPAEPERLLRGGHAYGAEVVGLRGLG
jgi:Ca2+-binding RTX toxin-like protein